LYATLSTTIRKVPRCSMNVRERHYAEYHNLTIIKSIAILGIVMSSVKMRIIAIQRILMLGVTIKLSDLMLSFVMLSVPILLRRIVKVSDVMLRVIMLSVVIPNVVHLSLEISLLC
jgi:hypothetical protein